MGAIWICQREVQVLSLSNTGKSLDLIRKEKNQMLMLLSSMLRMNLLSMQLLGKEKKICAAFDTTPQTAKVMATLHDKCSGWKRQ